MHRWHAPDTVPQGWYPSIDSLVLEVVAAIDASDRKRLESLCISREEYLQLIWPNLTIARIPQWQSREDFVWQQHDMKSSRGLESILNSYGGRKLSVVSVTFRESPVVYGTCIVRPGVQVALRDDRGQEMVGRLFSSIVEKDGFFKVFSYNIH